MQVDFAGLSKDCDKPAYLYPALRPVPIGRKNYLFCGNHSAAEDAALFYSLLGCCKAA
jgi:hypothetical protein